MVAVKPNGWTMKILVVFGAVGVLVGTVTTSVVTIIQATRTTEKLEAVHNETKQTNVAMNAIHRAALVRNLSDKERIFGLTKLEPDELAVKQAMKDIVDHDEQQRRVDIEKGRQQAR